LFILSGVQLSLCISYSTCINFVQIFSPLHECYTFWRDQWCSP
jgi:hypothetical protein